jgi:hypothetical protein
MIDWEVMVSNSNTRWHWDTLAYAPEPVIPWHQHVWPDGSPVSYTEAGAIRRYITGKDEFIFYDDFLNSASDSNPQSDEKYLDLAASATHSFHSASLLQTRDFLFETTFWLRSSSIEIAFRQSFKGGYSIRINADDLTLQLLKIRDETHREVLATFDISTLDCKLETKGWNMLRVLVVENKIDVYFNTMYPDFFPSGVLPMPGGAAQDIQLAPPRISFVDDAASFISDPGCIVVTAGTAGAWVDYLSVLPPRLYGEPWVAASSSHV